jgi:hypothetical protein
VLVELIYSVTWRLARSKGPSFFITTDNPVFFFEDFGLKGEEAELNLPLASDLALHGCWQPLGLMAKSVLPFNEYFVKEFNRRLVSAATRFVFYHEQKTWVRTIAQKTHHYLSLIRW